MSDQSREGKVLLIGPARQETSKEEAKAKDRVARGTGVHDLFLDNSGYILVDFLRLQRVSLRLVQAERFFAVGTFSHRILQWFLS